MNISCAGCKSTDYILSDCSKYIHCNSCKEYYYSECTKCKSYKLGTVMDKYGFYSQKCMYCDTYTKIYEVLPKDKPEFNGVYDENNKYQQFANLERNFKDIMLKDAFITLNKKHEINKIKDPNYKQPNFCIIL